MKVVKLADKNESSKSWSAKDALEHALEKVKQTDKILIIRLDEIDNNYEIGFTQAGMRMSECISLIEVVKIKFLKEMGYI